MMVSDEFGYSLLELLVAVAIIALAAVPLSQGLTTGFRTWENVNSDTSDLDRIFHTRKRLRSWIGSAVVHDPLRKGSGLDYSLVGSPRSVSFSAAISPDGRNDQLYQLTLGVGESSNLQMSILPDHSNEDDAIQSELTLLTGVSDLTFEYLDGSNSFVTWLPTWSDRIDMPSAIKIKLTFIDGASIWSDLIVPLRTEEWSHCAYDAATASCLSGVV